MSLRARCRLLIGLQLTVTSFVASPARADGTSSAMIGISRSGQSTPRSSTWNGSAWTSSAAALNVGEIQAWIVTRNCPTRNETAMATLDYQDDLNLQFYKNGIWTQLFELCSNTGIDNSRCYDVAYEQLSGRMLIAFWNDSTDQLIYHTYDGTTMSGANSIALPSSSTVRWVRLVPKPESNEIAAIIENDSKKLYAMFWNGSAFGSITTLNTELDTASKQCFDAAYETIAGRLLVAYAIEDSKSPCYRIWSGSSWTSQASMPSIGGKGRWLRLEADPASNQILFGAIDNEEDLNVNVWNGSAWGTNQELETTACWSQLRAFDIAYEGGGTRALIAYADSWDNRFRYRTWNGASWSSEVWGHNLGNTPCVIQLRTGSTTGEVFLAVHDNSSRLNACRWNGSTFSSNQVVESDMSNSWGKECFMIAAPAALGLVPAELPYAHDFESPMGAEWSDSTRSSVSTYTNYAGRHHSKPLKLALNTTPGETYTVMFDFYAIDSWDGSTSNNNSAPDYFNISAGSTQIFSHTLTHEWPNTRAGSYPYSYDQIGNYGYNSWHKDAIFRKMQATFTATDTTTTLAFQGVLTDENNAGVGDESWGIDNIAVEVARFVDVSSATGFAVSTSTDFDNYGGGMSWGDFDNDGDLDCFISGNTARLLKNNDAGASFTAVSLGDLRRQAAMVDIDNDGDLDVWVATTNDFSTERCMLNSGSASFTSGGNLGFSGPSNNENCVAADVNADGWPDVVMFSENGNWIGHHTGSTSPALTGTNASSYGLHTSGQYGNGDYASAGDVNKDGRLDFFYHYGGGRLFCSNGDGTYTYNNRNIGITTGESLKLGSAWGDYDNDGDLDLATARMSEACSGYLWRNDCFTPNGFTGNFTNVTSSAGLALNTVVDYGPDDKPGTRSVAWGDYDNDGDLDLFILGAKGAHYLYQNQGNGTFQRVAHGISTTGTFIDCCFVDYDNDGDLDLALTRENGTAMLYRNRTNNASYLKVCLTGRGAGGTPKDAIGTRVELWNAAGTQLLARRDIGVARGYGGTEPIWAHFGGVNPSTEYQLKVYFATTTTVKTVRPGETSTTIGTRTIPQMISISESSPATIMKWKENVNKPAL